MQSSILLLLFLKANFGLSEISVKIGSWYNKEVLPFHQTSSHKTALNVSVQMYINNMIPVEHKDMHYHLDFLLRQYWNDPRLTFAKLKVPETRNEEILFNEKIFHEIWLPDLFFPTAKNEKLHKVTLPNRVFLLKSDGEIFYSQRLSMQVYCSMDFSNFPFDMQRCNFSIRSYAYNKYSLRLIWNKGLGGPVFPPHTMNMLEFTLTNIENYRKEGIDKNRESSFDRLIVEFTFERNYAFYVLQMYLPAVLVVMLSWVGFWIDYRSTPARVSLGITTVLTMVTLANSIRNSIPQSNYLKSLDIYVIICLLFVFITVVEYALLGVVENKWRKEMKKKSINTKKTRLIFKPRNMRKRKQSVMKRSDGKIIYKTDDTNEVINFKEIDENEVKQLRKKHKKIKRKTSNRLRSVIKKKENLGQKIMETQSKNQESHLIDRVMRKIFPTIFFLFNAFYFYFSLT